MKQIKILFFFITLALLFVTLSQQRTQAATCDTITWNTPLENTTNIFTLSGTIANCPGTRHVRVKIQYQRTDNSDQPTTLMTPVTVTGGALSTDVPFTYPVTIILTLYDVDNTDSVIVNPNCNTVPDNLKSNSKCNWLYYTSITPGKTVPGTTPSAPAITCNNSFSFTGDQSLLVCPKDCPTLINLQGTNYQCSTQNLTNLSLATADVRLSLKPKSDAKDTYIVNQAYATYLGSSGSTTTTTPGSGADIPPNDNTCNGHYIFGEWPNISQLKNFGDPECTMDEPKERDNLYAMLQQLDPSHVDDWFNNIIPCETGHTYSPNSFKGDSPASGAYGLFQMGGSGQGGTIK